MAIVARESGGGERKLIPADSHRAVCDMIVDLGMQPSELYGPKHQVYIRWCLPDEQIEYTDKDDNQKKGPMVTGGFYTVSLHEKSKLRPMLESWRGQAFTEAELAGFDINDVAGKACLLSVIHKEKGGKMRDVISAVSKLPKGIDTPKLPADQPPMIYDDDHQHNFNNLPEWLQKTVNRQIEQDPDLVKAAVDEMKGNLGSGFARGEDEPPI